MEYLTAEQILLIHSLAVDETSGGHGVRDYHPILTLVDLPRQQVFGQELYPTIFLKAAVYARNIVTAHPFIDGNKRTGMLTAIVFLENNEHRFTAPSGVIEKFALRVATERLDLETIAAWLKRYSRKRKK